MRRPEFDLSAERVTDLLAAFDLFGFQVVAPAPWPMDLPDPDDEPFLATASVTASTLITGNLRHFPLRARGGVTVVSPRELIESLKSRDA